MNVIIESGIQKSWNEFNSTRTHSIALDGYVADGPQWDEATVNANFDHHSGVVREATMSTAMQVYFALKGGLSERYTNKCDIYINDVDQDTCMAIWLLLHANLFEGTSSLPHINRILTLNDRMDITGGAFPMNLDDKVYYQHCWIFEPYTSLRKTGEIAKRNVKVYESCLQAVFGRLDKLLMGTAGEYIPEIPFDILHSSKNLVVVDETFGGIEARHALFANGTIKNAYLSVVAKRDDGRFVYTIGRRSRYVHFPIHQIYKKLNEIEGCQPNDCWGGSDIVGGSPRTSGSNLSWNQIVDVINHHSD